MAAANESDQQHEPLFALFGVDEGQFKGNLYEAESTSLIVAAF